MEGRVQYWAKRWENGESSWHLKAVNKHLENNFHFITEVKLGPCHVFVPLCGKTIDLKWIYDQGHIVVGVEAVEKPILEFFEEHSLQYKRKIDDGITTYCTLDGKLNIIYSDLFDLPSSFIGKFDGVWDRGSIVAIHPEDRQKYVTLLKSLLNEKFAYILYTPEYDPSLFEGPPKCLSYELIQSLFGEDCRVELVEKADMNTDPSSPYSAKVRWNLDECYEIVFLIKPVM